MVNHFYLDKPENTKSVIMVSISFESHRLRLSTGISISTKSWDKKFERIKNSYSHSSEINTILSNFKAKVEDIFTHAKYQKVQLTITTLKNEIDLYLHPEKLLKKEGTFFEHFFNFIMYRSRDSRFGSEIIKVYNTTMNKLKVYESETKTVLNFNIINENFYIDYTNYLLYKGLNNGGIAKHIKTIKTFMKFCFDRGLTNNTSFMKFKVWKNDVITVALSEDELKKLETMDLSSNPRLNDCRNLFLLQIYTGLRFSDLVNLKPENFNTHLGIIEIYETKTKEKIQKPLTDKILRILSGYDAMQLPRISNQKQNVNLKELAKIARFDQMIQTTTFRGNKKIEVVSPKYELISTHTARRTYITLSLKRGANPEMVMKISGHRDRKSFQRYVRITQNEAVDELRRIWEE